jgi:hypothetical protein
LLLAENSIGAMDLKKVNVLASKPVKEIAPVIDQKSPNGSAPWLKI